MPWFTLWRSLRVRKKGSLRRRLARKGGHRAPLARPNPRHSSGVGLSWAEHQQASVGRGQGTGMDTGMGTGMDMGMDMGRGMGMGTDMDTGMGMGMGMAVSTSCFAVYCATRLVGAQTDAPAKRQTHRYLV